MPENVLLMMLTVPLSTNITPPRALFAWLSAKVVSLTMRVPLLLLTIPQPSPLALPAMVLLLTVAVPPSLYTAQPLPALLFSRELSLTVSLPPT